MAHRSRLASTFNTRRSTSPWLCDFEPGPSAPLDEVDNRRNTCSSPVCDDFGGAGVYGPSPPGREPGWRTAFLAGVIFGTENSVALGETLFDCGGLLCPALPLEENLDEMFENHEFRRWGDEVEEGCRFSSAADLAEFDRVRAFCCI